MATPKRRTAVEIIAFHFCSDMRDISESRYQPTSYATPAVYCVGNDYYAAPASNSAPKYKDIGGDWDFVAEYYGRKIYRSKAI